MERSFSHGRILITHLCNRLCSATIHALMCFGDWLRLDLFTNNELEASLEANDNAVKAGKAASGPMLVDNEIFASLL